MADLVWLSDQQWTVFEPFIPVNQPGLERKDDRRIPSGILRVLTPDCSWRDCPKEGGVNMQEPWKAELINVRPRAGNLIMV